MPRNDQEMYQIVGDPWEDESLGIMKGDQLAYQISVADKGVTCSCKGFLYRGHCKHVAWITDIREMKRMPYDQALGLFKRVAGIINPYVVGISAAGSLRREEASVRDIDIVLIPNSDVAWRQIGRMLKDHADSVMVSGEVIIRMIAHGVQLDLHRATAENWGATLLFYTGSKAFNIFVRSRAKSQGMKLNEYGLWEGARLIASRREIDIMSALNMSCISPTCRTKDFIGDMHDILRRPQKLDKGEERVK